MRPRDDRGEEAAPVLEVPRAPAAILLVEGGDRERELPGQEHAVGVELRAVAVPGTGAVAERQGGAAELGHFGGLVDDAARGADAEEDAVGPAAVLVAARAVRVHGHDASEVVETQAGGQATHEDRGRQALGVDDGVLLRAGLVLVGVHLAVDAVAHQLGDVGDGDVVEELAGEHGEGTRGVAERGVEPAAGERVLRGVADVAVGGDLERGEFHGRRGGRRGGRRRRGGWRDLGGEWRDEGEQERQQGFHRAGMGAFRAWCSKKSRTRGSSKNPGQSEWPWPGTTRSSIGPPRAV